jgi:hypothetical protein
MKWDFCFSKPQALILIVKRSPPGSKKLAVDLGQPKSTACIYDIWENKVTGGETTSFAPTRTIKSFLSR